MSDHYSKARAAIAELEEADAQYPTHMARLGAIAQAEASLYVGEQLEVVAGVFATARTETNRPDALTREQYGMGGD